MNHLFHVEYFRRYSGSSASLRDPAFWMAVSNVSMVLALIVFCVFLYRGRSLTSPGLSALVMSPALVGLIGTYMHLRSSWSGLLNEGWSHPFSVEQQLAGALLSTETGMLNSLVLLIVSLSALFLRKLGRGEAG
ncbi:MAG TPA: hypothetical protein VF614_05515 [Chthoniobacteraceae bacterium]|jgi:hypothetical protein